MAVSSATGQLRHDKEKGLRMHRRKQQRAERFSRAPEYGQEKMELRICFRHSCLSPERFACARNLDEQAKRNAGEAKLKIDTELCRKLSEVKSEK